MWRLAASRFSVDKVENLIIRNHIHTYIHSHAALATIRMGCDSVRLHVANAVAAVQFTVYDATDACEIWTAQAQDWVSQPVGWSANLTVSETHCQMDLQMRVLCEQLKRKT